MTIVGVPGIAKGVDWSSIYVKELSVKATNTYSHADFFRGKKVNSFDLAIELLSNGSIDLGWMVTHKFRIDELPRALSLLGNRKDEAVIKAVFDFAE